MIGDYATMEKLLTYTWRLSFQSATADHFNVLSILIRFYKHNATSCLDNLKSSCTDNELTAVEGVEYSLEFLCFDEFDGKPNQKNMWLNFGFRGKANLHRNDWMLCSNANLYRCEWMWGIVPRIILGCLVRPIFVDVTECWFWWSLWKC